MKVLNRYKLLVFCHGVMIAALTGCGEIQYYMQSAKGHLDIVNNSQDIEQLIADDNLDNDTRNKLTLILQAREFAANELDLSFNDSYTSYVKLNRDYAVKNLFAAKEFSTQLYSWCYPVIGCANYRGYFDEAMLQQDRETLILQDYDTYVVKAAAYSTLGWDDDPVLNSFLEWPEYMRLGLVFHELAHQQIYIEDDTFFNESFATAVEQSGLER
ncbi:MAG: aminopeptidase, partial [Gammaproteobacteria bacterium]|nr:aminopeptidase [Gammaproteobacteria bacterium]